MPTQLRISPPPDYVLARDACSYGYFLLSPNNWSPASGTFTTTLDLAGRGVGDATTIHITQPGERASHAHLRGRALRVNADRTLTDPDRAELRRLVTRILRLDEPEQIVRDFHKRDPRYAPRAKNTCAGRGRLMRSPTLFEDVIKTVTSCNVTWPSTIIMNRGLCQVLGRRSASELHAFPTAEKVAAARPATLRARCTVGYRDQRIVDLAKMFARGKINEAWLEDPATPDDEVFEALLEWPGIGPYAAANIMQLLGRYARLPLDTESIRHGKAVLGYKGTDRAIMAAIHKHYQPMGAHAFRSYWFELWEFYEAKHGPSWTWERDSTGKLFTAALLAK